MGQTSRSPWPRHCPQQTIFAIGLQMQLQSDYGSHGRCKQTHLHVF